MKILFVVNSYYAVGNGLSASARRTVATLEQLGHEVRVLSGPNTQSETPQPYYRLEKMYFPIFQPIIDANGYAYAKSDDAIMEEAAKWADVVHLEEPFVLEIKMIKICKKWGKPMTSTYHLHPENITFAFGPLLYWKGLNRTILRAWRNLVFNHCQAVQCPTENVLDRLRRYHFKAQLHQISNGIILEDCIRPATPPANLEDPQRPVKVLCIGRLSPEKDQQTLLDAMKYCKQAHRIQLQFAGQGIHEKKLKKQAQQLFQEGVLKYEPEFYFLDKQGLKEISAAADIAVHCAFIEVEGLSIMEAIQQAAMPIIAESRYSGTAQFALDRRCRFPSKNPEALANRIDYWIAHPKERWEMGFRHAENIKKYDINRCVQALADMMEKAIEK